MLRRSATVAAGGTTPRSLTTGSDSPVNVDSSIRRPVALMSRRSAVTLSPASR